MMVSRTSDESRNETSPPRSRRSCFNIQEIVRMRLRDTRPNSDGAVIGDVRLKVGKEW